MSRGTAVPLLGLALTLFLALVTPASAAGTQTYPMPRTGTVTIAGHGYGHGHGMSQYGAEGAARQGLGWPQIVRFYYPGTTVRTRNPRVRVLISADTSRDVVVSPRSGLRARDTGSGETWQLPENGADRWRFDVAGSGRTALAYRKGGTWRRFALLEGDGFFAAKGKPIRLHLGTTSKLYRGRLFSARPSAGSTDRDTVNALRLNAYVKGVVPHEIPVSWQPAAVRAQAVAARTYAAYERGHPRAGHYQLCDTSSCQVYGGYGAEDPRSNDAVRATRKRILVDSSGEPAFTQFGSSNGGWTSANRFSYLPAQQDPYDGWSGNPVHDWRVRMDVSRIEKAFPALGNLREIRVTERDGNGQWGGRVRTLVLDGGKADIRVSGDTFRLRLGLRSTWFSFP
ncbi:SpoIID/LytB domain-containing protein [Nocardioides donggukensis]|uniref:SpoIID/LytB domain-containing protein n=1 Tax=Nocardioides donggukensis TaxID=2774019 RepID=A0A927K4E6_9ACTN|nr:SpoIID/LytB domain-containing protein [Nocardioides donggukensis]MBD8868688.1 SpoIID/LytB domain-containing protein [Nocardioides donggukensis]